ncbi:MAG: hypothetical protein FJ291_09485, partial [Planctomycetes bacterium]|nr:hypothetical protein [Planctomycetota bacterium]
MDDFDDFDPTGPQRDSSKTIFMLLVLMAAMVVVTTLLAPKPKPPEAKKPEDEKATTQVDAKAKPPSTVTRLTTGLPPKGTTATPAVRPEPPTKQPEPPRAPEHEIQPVELTRSSNLLCATFTNQDARLARLVLLDHYRTPVDKRAARRARRRDPNADLSSFGLPLLGQEEATALENGDFELGDTIPGSQETPTRPRDWNASETVGNALLWSQDARRGSRSAAIKDPTSDAAWATTVPGIEPGETYELACWVKLDAPDGLPDSLLPSVKAVQQVSTKEGAAWKDDKGELHPAVTELRPTKAAGWQRLDGRFIAEPATKQVQLLLRAPKGFKGQVWFDDLSLLKLGGASLVLLEPKRAASEPLSAEEKRLFDPRRFRVASASEDAVAFRARIPGTDIEVTKTFILPKPDDPLQRHITLEVQFRNLGDKELKHPGYLLRGPGGLAADLTPASWKHGRTVPDPFERQTAADALTASVAREAPGGQINVPAKACSELKSLETGSKEVKPA